MFDHRQKKKKNTSFLYDRERRNGYGVLKIVCFDKKKKQRKVLLCDIACMYNNPSTQIRLVSTETL